MRTTYSYQWVRSDGTTDSDISGATSTTYVVTTEDVASTLWIRVSFTDDDGNPESLTSTATTAVAAGSNSPATGSPTITGKVQEGQTLTGDTTGIADADGLNNVGYRYQWLSSRDTEIEGRRAPPTRSRHSTLPRSSR